jgi:flagellar biogenesis protein FliO
MGGFALVLSLLKVAAVLGALILCLRLLARHQRGRTGVRSSGRTTAAPLIEVVDQSRLGRTANVVAVRVGERVLLLGVTEAGIETLADVSDDIDLTVDDPDEPPPGSVLDHAVDLLRTGGFKR